MAVEVKLCGLKTPEAINEAALAGANYVGLVFYPDSPRAVTVEQAATLARLIPGSIRAVGLFVEPDDVLLEQVLAQAPIDMIQLHGQESPDRVAEIRANYGLEIMKAVSIGDKQDVKAAERYFDVADRLLFDARPTGNVVSALPGGTGIAFDWTLIRDYEWPLPWMLAGGLTPENVGDAIRETGARAVDVSSGIEDRPGHKDPEKIRAFMEAVKEVEV